MGEDVNYASGFLDIHLPFESSYVVDSIVF